MLLMAASDGLFLVAVGCFAVVTLHAFKRSLGTGFMVLCIPFYQVVYGFTQFEHRFKGAILAGWIGCLVPAIALKVMGLAHG